MSSPDNAVNDDAALRTLADYYRAFSTLEVQAVWPYFHEPSLLISPQGVFAVPTFAALATVFTPTMEGLRTRHFSRSELSVGYVKSLSASATLVTGIAIRYNATDRNWNGQESHTFCTRQRLSGKSLLSSCTTRIKARHTARVPVDALPGSWAARHQVAV
jgi:hypothetical protein